ncbi:multicopper oxidase type 3 [Paenibacillus curdlanolyticus YK9]|uniref:Multicopper oxidase type 3 n=1 Tax=Paenibacillus curdlanolyticus YK9 TaxID=717606 RepID=E0I832_9BACL|nr:hypothetical protein [Paenibacillus curdlanolyticus]EFM11337.1 multicopper oxidase type 3 [Paenibacillus curdlanolyticus YK9]
MYRTLFGIELGLLSLLAILAWVGGIKTFRLVRAGSAGQMARRTRRLIAWAAYASLAAGAIAAAALMLAADMAPHLWLDWLGLHLPLAILPMAALWLVTAPRLRMLRAKARELDGALPYELRAEAAKPVVVLPFQAVALGALTELYLALAAPVSLRFMDVLAPLLVYGSALGWLYVRNHRRWRKASELSALMRYQLWGGRFMQKKGAA